MKKRSLFAAVAMLIVSAIVLTSSTYAWFATTQQAYADKVVAKVSGSDAGNVLISAGTNSENWKGHLEASELYSAGNGIIDPVPVVDWDPINDFNNCSVATFDGQNYTVAAGTQSSIPYYTFRVKALNVPNDGNTYDIQIPVQFTGGSTAAAIHGAIKIDSGNVTTIYGGQTYYPIDNSNRMTTATDSTGTGHNSGVIDAGEFSSGALTSAVGNTGTTPLTITNVSSNDTHTITVFLWAEGQDRACTGSINVTDAGFTFGTSSAGIKLVQHS